MNIEIYEEKRRNTLYENKEGKNNSRNSADKEKREIYKKQVKQARAYCTEFDSVFLRVGILSEKSIDAAKILFSKFQGIDIGSLPKSVQLVFKRRTLYLQTMVELSRNIRIPKLFGKFSKSSSEQNLLKLNPEELFEKLKNSSLKDEDYLELLMILRKGKRRFADLLSDTSKWVLDARKVLNYGELNDKEDAKKFYDNLAVLIKNISTVQRKKAVGKV